MGAKKVSIKKTKPGNNNQKPFERMMIMEYELKYIGKVKMTVGIRRRTQEKVQYCITAIQSEWQQKKASLIGCLFYLPQMRGGGLHSHVMLCWRGLRTTHIHRPLTTYFLGAKVRTFSDSSKSFCWKLALYYIFFVSLQCILHRMQSYLLNFPLEPRTRKGILRANLYIVGVVPWRRLHHKCIGAFAGLSGNMAGLRFSYVRKYSACSTERRW